ncbi:MAG: TIGR03620 family F420-dependent LLM class oxidoreductase [Proteobacteria bacterium]|nr:TIGR03620 family F420-dependent LLM class oxidoreductase [Pseudomonadota bacterium]
MKFGRLGVFTFTDTMNAAQLADLAQRVEGLGYSTLWYPEVFHYETFGVGGYLLSKSRKLIVGSGIANIYARDPAAAAMGHNTLNELYDGRFVLGLGVSHAPLVSGVRGHEYKRPVATMRAYLDGMDGAWNATHTSPAGKQVVLAALGPKMSELAGQRTLGAFPYNVTPQQAATSRNVMGPKAAVICEQKVCLTEDPMLARQVARANLAMYLTLPNYYENWYRLGFNESDLHNGGSDRLMDAMVLWGSAETIKSKLRAYFDRGADQVVIQPLSSSGRTEPDWKALEALASL